MTRRTPWERWLGCGALVPTIQGPLQATLRSPGCWQIFGEVLAKECGPYSYPLVDGLRVEASAVCAGLLVPEPHREQHRTSTAWRSVAGDGRAAFGSCTSGARHPSSAIPFARARECAAASKRADHHRPPVLGTHHRHPERSEGSLNELSAPSNQPSGWGVRFPDG